MSLRDALLLLQKKQPDPNFVYRYTYYGFIPMCEIVEPDDTLRGILLDRGRRLGCIALEKTT